MRKPVSAGAFKRQVWSDRRQLDLAGRAVVLRDCRLDTGLGDHNGLDVEAGHELNIVHGKDVGGIDHRHGQGCTYTRKR